MADITSTLSAFDEWMKKRRMAQVTGMGTIESGDFGARPYYTGPTGLGEAGPMMNPTEYSKLQGVMNPPISAEPMESVLPPGPGTAGREEGIESVRLAAQGVPKSMLAAQELAPEAFNMPDVYSGQRYVPGTETAPTDSEGYARRWQMASALESAGKPYWEKTKEGYKPVFQPESVLKGKLETYGGAIEADVKNKAAQAQAFLAEGKFNEARSALAEIETILKPAESAATIKEIGAKAASALADVGYKGALGGEAAASAAEKRSKIPVNEAEAAWIRAGKPTTGPEAEEYQKGVLGILQKFGPPTEDTRRSIFGFQLGAEPSGVISKGALEYWNSVYGPRKKEEKKSLWEQYK